MSLESNEKGGSRFGRKPRPRATIPFEIQMRVEAAESRAHTAETRVDDLKTELMFYGDAIRALKSELEAVTERAVSRVAPQVVELEARNAETEALRRSVDGLRSEAESERSRLHEWRTQMESLVSALKNEIDNARAHIDAMPERIRDALTPTAQAMAAVGARMSSVADLSMPSPAFAAPPPAGPVIEAIPQEEPSFMEAPSFDYSQLAPPPLDALAWNE